ncbi:hypothetical protein [Thermodesulfatator atlanticus]|uniref:hypothetical protein n=1 Tax=Thermodesulfatator atlanticus TaxID=501497 RepID=UPI0003B37EB7|nr:hypothetical protein [Thermodesulfatator atlanticus]
MAELEYLTDAKGRVKGVFIPIELWQRIFPDSPTSLAEMIETIEDYCLNKAMDEAKKTPLYSKEEALKYLEDE